MSQAGHIPPPSLWQTVRNGSLFMTCFLNESLDGTAVMTQGLQPQHVSRRKNKLWAPLAFVPKNIQLCRCFFESGKKRETFKNCFRFSSFEDIFPLGFHWYLTWCVLYFFFMTQSADRHKHTDVRTRSLLIWSSCLCCYCEVITQIWVSLARSLCFLISSLVSFTTMRKHLTTIHHLHGEIQTRKSCQGKQGLEKLFCLPVDRVVDLTLQTVS